MGMPLQRGTKGGSVPELPEVETMRRGVLGAISTTITEVHWPKSRFKPIQVTPRRNAFSRRVARRVIRAVERLGKRIVLRLDDENVIAFEPRMTGLLLTADPPDDDHVRLLLKLQGGSVSTLQFWDRRGLGTISLLTPAQLASRWGPEKVGPDALVVTVGELRQRLGRRQTAIKVALLDQASLAGIGNLYASEILHVALVHPELPCRRLSARQWKRVHAAMLSVLQEAIRYEGSTLSDGTYRTALNSAGSYQHHHRVYDREGQTCPTCARSAIRRIIQSQRSTFFCPRCQRKR